MIINSKIEWLKQCHILSCGQEPTTESSKGTTVAGRAAATLLAPTKRQFCCRTNDVVNLILQTANKASDPQPGDQQSEWVSRKY